MKALFVLVTLLCPARLPGQATHGPVVALTGSKSNFLVKLTSSMSTESSKAGDKVTAVVIGPVALRGGRVEGAIERADRSILRFSFDTLRFEGKTFRMKSEVTSVVNSKGNLGHDDLGQRIRIANGGLIAYGTKTAVDEGAEIRFVGWEQE